MKKIIYSISLFAIGYLLFATQVNAQAVSCQPIYGGGQVCTQAGNLLINKTVLNPENSSFVDNLGINDPKHGPDQTVTFKISVKNTGGSIIPSAIVKDILPQFVDFTSGAGNFDPNTKVLSFEVNNLNPNETREFKITGKVVPSNILPGQSIVCVVNQAVGTMNGQTSQDNAEFCIQKVIVTPTPEVVTTIPITTKGGVTVFPAPQPKVTPPTGPEMIPLLALIPSGIVGFILRKKSF